MKNNLAPSYKAVVIAILKNDHNLVSLGFKAPVSVYYSILKRKELVERGVILDLVSSIPKLL